MGMAYDFKEPYKAGHLSGVNKLLTSTANQFFMNSLRFGAFGVGAAEERKDEVVNARRDSMGPSARDRRMDCMIDR